jgi:hypothetical protein
VPFSPNLSRLEEVLQFQLDTVSTSPADAWSTLPKFGTISKQVTICVRQSVEPGRRRRSAEELRIADATIPQGWRDDGRSRDRDDLNTWG